MDYAKQSNEEQPFEGLSLEEKKRLWVYMCHIAHPCFTAEEIERRWGRVLGGDEVPTVFSALEIAKEIKDEIRASDTSVQPKGVVVTKKSRTVWISIIIFCVVFLLIGVLCYLLNKEQMRKEVAADQQLMKIDEEFGVDTVSAYNHLREIEKNSMDARCRRHLCEVFGIGTKLTGARLSNCPIHGNCLERAAASKAFCKGFSSLGWVDDAGLKSLREECKKIAHLKEYDIKLLQRVANLGDRGAIKELAECYTDGVKIEKNNSAAIFLYSKYIAIVSDVNELRRLRKLFSANGQFPNDDLLLKVLERLASFDDVSSLVLLGEKFSFSNPQKSSEYFYRALCKNAVLSLERMLICAKVFEQSKQMTKAAAFYEESARQNDFGSICWLGTYWYDRMNFFDNKAVLGCGAHLSHRWDRMPECRWEVYSHAKHWLELAAAKGGNLEVFLKLSLLYGVNHYYNGSSIITSLRNALKFGSEDAAFELGVIYERGLYNVVANQAEARRLYLIAANKGHPYAQLSYAYLLESPQEAWEWVAKAATQGNVEAQYQFGRLHDFYGWGGWGIGRWKQLRCSRDSHWSSKQTIVPTYGCEKYQRSAIEWYRLAAKNGYEPAERELAAHNATLE